MYPFFIVVSERNVHVQEGMILLLHSFVGIQIETAFRTGWTGGGARSAFTVDRWMRVLSHKGPHIYL